MQRAAESWLLLAIQIFFVVGKTNLQYYCKIKNKSYVGCVRGQLKFCWRDKI